MAPPAATAFVAPLCTRAGISSVTGLPLRASRRPHTASTSLPPRRRAVAAPITCCDHGSVDSGGSFDVGHSASVDHAPSLDAAHGSHASDAHHGNGDAHHGNGEAHHGNDDAPWEDDRDGLRPKRHAAHAGEEGAGTSSMYSSDVLVTSADSKVPVQGPAPAPTKDGVSTVGMAEKDAKFIVACYDADVAVIEAALDDGQDVNVVDVNRRSALHFCAGNGLPTVCRRLLEMGAEVDARDVLGFTPLHMATGYKKIDTVKLLVEADADANIASLQGELAVEIAERMFKATPEKRFFMKNDDYGRLKEIVEVLDAATELEEEDEEDEEEEILQVEEETASAKFVVRVKPKSEDDSPNTPPPPPPPAGDVKVTIRVKKPKK